jgi:hypothetical protein
LASYRNGSPSQPLVQEVVAQEPGVRVFVVHSEERLAYERAQRIKAMDRVRTRLEKLQRRYASTRTTQLYDRRRDEMGLDEDQSVAVVMRPG